MVDEKKDELRRSMGGILARAAEALAEVRDAVVRQAQIGKLKLDANSLRRQRDAACREFGEAMYRRAGEGEWKLEPELQAMIDRISALDEKLSRNGEEIVAIFTEAEGMRALPAPSRVEEEPRAERDSQAKTVVQS